MAMVVITKSRRAALGETLFMTIVNYRSRRRRYGKKKKKNERCWRVAMTPRDNVTIVHARYVSHTSPLRLAFSQRTYPVGERRREVTRRMTM